MDEHELDLMKEEATKSAKMGPGCWSLLHLAGLEVDETREYEHFVFLVNLLAKRFKANVCREHFVEYASTHRIERGKAFEWSVHAHNDVNARTGKATITLQEARDIWGDGNTKITPCSSSSKPQVSQQPIYFSTPSNYTTTSTPPMQMGTMFGPLAWMNSAQQLYEYSTRR